MDALTNYKAELRDRDIFRIETALLETGDTPLIVHKLYNAETGTLCTAVQQRLAGVSLPGDTVEWDGAPREDRPVPADGPNWVASQRSVVRPEEADWTGHLALSGHIHRFSTANSFIDVDSCVAQRGGSSIRLFHRVRDGETGEDIAGLSQFGVQLDLDARRPKRIADDLRERAQALLATA